MGHLTNPTGFRVGRTARWAHRWSSDKFTYFKYFTLSQSIYNYLFYFFKLKDIKFGMMFSHVRLLFALKTIFIRVYLYSRDYLRLSKKRYVNFISRARFYFVRKKRSLLGNKLLLNDATNRKTNKFKKKYTNVNNTNHQRKNKKYKRKWFLKFRKKKFLKKGVQPFLLIESQVKHLYRFIAYPLAYKRLFVKNTLNDVLSTSYRKYRLYRFRRYFLFNRVKQRFRIISDYFRKMGRVYKPKKKYRYTPQQYFFRRWRRKIVREEIAQRYSFFNNLKAPLLARTIYGPLLFLITKIFKIDFFKYFKNINLLMYNIVVSLKFINNFNLSASVVLQYFIARLRLLYLPREILPRIMNRIFPSDRVFNVISPPRRRWKRTPLVKGIMFKCKGRFTRTQMASYQVYKAGRLPLSTISANVKYAFGTISLKYGSLGLKVFILS